MARRGSVRKLALVVTATIGLALASALAWLVWAPRRVPPGQAPLSTIDEVAEFRRAFEGGEVRLLALLSPT